MYLFITENGMSYFLRAHCPSISVKKCYRWFFLFTAVTHHSNKIARIPIWSGGGYWSGGKPEELIAQNQVEWEHEDPWTKVCVTPQRKLWGRLLSPDTMITSIASSASSPPPTTRAFLFWGSQSCVGEFWPGILSLIYFITQWKCFNRHSIGAVQIIYFRF